MLGVTTLAPLVARPLAALIGWPLNLRGAAGELARQNAMRNPRRTASTAAALMIGLTMVATMSVFASSIKASFGDVLAGSTKADLFVATSSVTSEGFSSESADVVARVPGVATLSAMGWGNAKFDGVAASYSAIDPATADEVLNLGLTSGSVRALAGDGVVVSRKVAEDRGWSVGQVIPVQFAAAGTRSVKVVGVYGRKGFVSSDYLIGLDLFQAANGGQGLLSTALVTVAPGADVGTVERSIQAALAGHPDARVLNEREYKKVAGGFVDQLLTFVTVMLLLAVVIALLGIVNTLALSVFERTRELGLLRAIGMTRGQVRAMVRWEAGVISLIGAAAGAALGIGLGVALVRAVKDQGITAVSVSTTQIGVYVAIAAAAGVVAAIGPSRRAAGVDVLKAVVTD